MCQVLDEFCTKQKTEVTAGPRGGFILPHSSGTGKLAQSLEHCSFTGTASHACTLPIHTFVTDPGLGTEEKNRSTQLC